MHKEKKNAYKTCLDVLKIRKFDEKLNAFFMADGSYMDILEIAARDRQNLQDDAVQFDIYALARFEKLYSADHKDIALNFPINTGGQRRFLERKIKKTKDPVRLLWLSREIEELELLDANIERKEFYRFIFAPTEQELIKNRGNVLSWLGQGRSRLIKEISKEKKIQVVKKMCNMNALITEDELKEINYD